MTNLIREHITTILKGTGYKSYYLEASNSATFPYITWSMDKTKIDSVKSIYDLELNIWDDNKDKTNIENLADDITILLDDEICLSDQYLLVFDEVTRGYVSDPNKGLNRLMLRFDMRFFK